MDSSSTVNHDIIYNSRWLIVIQLIRVIIVWLLSDLVNTTESALSVCDKSYHTNKRKVPKGGE